MGALGMAGFAQTFYYSGNLPISNMPEVRRDITRFRLCTVAHGGARKWHDCARCFGSLNQVVQSS